MKSRTLCACLVAMLCMSTVAFGEILKMSGYTHGDNIGNSSSGGNSWSSVASIRADGDDELSWATFRGWEFTYTTDFGHFTIQIFLYAEASAFLWLWDGEMCTTWGEGEAKYTMYFGGQDTTVTAWLQDSGYDGEIQTDYPEPDQRWIFGTDVLFSGEGIFTAHQSTAFGLVPVGGDCLAISGAGAVALGELYTYP